VIAPSVSVWALLQRDFDLHWSAVNSHFVVGMLGFMTMILTRTLIAGQGLPLAIRAGSGSIAASALLLMLSIVNRGVASGGGQQGVRYGANVMSLLGRYVVLLVSQATTAGSIGLLELSAVFLSGIGIVTGLVGVLYDKKEKDKVD